MADTHRDFSVVADGAELRCSAIGAGVRVSLTPAVAGAVVRVGAARGRTDAAGVAILRACAPTARGIAVGVTAAGFAPARTRLRATGRTRPC